MKNTAIKKYLTCAEIGQNEIELLQGLIKENNNGLSDYLPEGEERNNVLTRLLSAAISVYDINKEFINNIVTVHPLKYKAVSQYFLTINVGENEIKLLNRLMQDNNNKLEDYLIEDPFITYNISNLGNNKRTYILSKLLKVALVKYDQYKDFVQDILSLHDLTNKIAFYWILADNIYGIEIIKKNPQYDITNADFEKSMDHNFDVMFNYDNIYIENAEILFPNWSKPHPILENLRMKKEIIKRYFNAENGCDGMYVINEEKFLKILGLTKETILNENILQDYKDELSKEVIENIVERLNFDKNEKQKILLDFTLPDKKDNFNKKKI